MSEPVDETHPSSATDVPTTSNAEHGQDSPETPKKRKRRWLGFSLKTFLLLLTGFCVWLGLLVHRVNKQKEAVQWVREHGGTHEYDFQREFGPIFFEEDSLPGPDWLRELIGIDYFADVVRVDLDVDRVDHLGPLTKLSDLQQLGLWGKSDGQTTIALAPLAELDELQHLLLHNMQVSDLTPLQHLTNLETLSVAHMPVSDLEFVRKLPRLRKLALAESKVADLGPLADLHELRKLEIDETLVTDLRPLQKLNGLRDLFITRTKVKDLKPLHELTQLETLDLQDTPVSDLTPLNGLSQLSTLWLDGTKVSDLRPLQDLPKLDHLTFQRTEVTDLEPLRHLKKLWQVSLPVTQSTDLKPLVGLPLVILELNGQRPREIPKELQQRIQWVNE